MCIKVHIYNNTDILHYINKAKSCNDIFYLIQNLKKLMKLRLATDV